jgi:hypothetical protein
MPAETLSRLLALHYPTDFILGNGEVAVLECIAGRKPTKVPQQYQHLLRWTADLVNNHYGAALSRWPKTTTLEIPGFGKVLFCHATPRDENECFTESTPENALVPIFAAAAVDAVVCGHTHMQFERMIGKTRVVNAGSVGMPFGEPGADWLLLSCDGIDLRHSCYDLVGASQRIRATLYPQAEEFAANNVLCPPSREKMLEVFSRIEIRA